MSATTGRGVRVLRTVYLPHENTDTLLLTIESLRAQLDEQAKLSSEHVTALEDSRRVSLYLCFLNLSLPVTEEGFTRHCNCKSRIRSSDDTEFRKQNTTIAPSTM